MARTSCAARESGTSRSVPTCRSMDFETSGAVTSSSWSPCHWTASPRGGCSSRKFVGRLQPLPRHADRDARVGVRGSPSTTGRAARPFARCSSFPRSGPVSARALAERRASTTRLVPASEASTSRPRCLASVGHRRPPASARRSSGRSAADPVRPSAKPARRPCRPRAAGRNPRAVATQQSRRFGNTQRVVAAFAVRAVSVDADTVILAIVSEWASAIVRDCRVVRLTRGASSIGMSRRRGLRHRNRVVGCVANATAREFRPGGVAAAQ